MSNDNVRGDNVVAKVNSDVKKAFCTWCSEAGLTVGTAIILFIRATLRRGQIPFPICACDIKDVDSGFECPCGGVHSK